MKKRLLQFISIMLVLTMLLPMIPIGVFATEQEEQQETPTYENVNNIYTVDGYKSAKPDGTLTGAQSGKVDEYSTTINFKTPVGYTNYSMDSGISQTPTTNNPDKGSVEASLSFAHDHDKIYIGIYDKSGTSSSTMRNGYTLRFGFDPEHPENYVGLYVQCVEFEVDSNDASKTASSDMLATTSTYTYSQAGFRGLALSNGSYYWQANLCDYTSSTPTDGLTRTYYTDETAATYPITAMQMVRQDVDGDISIGSTQHGRIFSGQYYTYFEIEIDKALMLDYFNGNYQDDGETPITSIDKMLFSLATADTVSSGENRVWNGSFDADVADKENALEAYNYDMVQFNATKGNVYNVDGYKSAKPDGTLVADSNGNVNEYSTTANLAMSGKSGNITFSSLRNSEYSEDELAHVSESISMSFAHDANKIYIGVLDKSGTGTVRNGYSLRLGFDTEHPENIVGIYLQCANVTGGGTASKSSVHDALVYTSVYTYSQAGYRGIARSNGNYEWYANTATTTTDGFERLKYTSDTAATYPVTAMKIAKEAVDGNITTSDSYGRVSSGQHYTYYEIELDKALLLDFYNGMTFNNGSAAVTDLNTMLFSLVQSETDSGAVPNVMWGGAFHAGAENKANAMEAFVYDVVEFSSTSTYKVDGYRKAVADGTLSGAQDGNVGEYSTTVNLNRPVAYSGSQTFQTLSDSYVGDARNAEAMSISFAHDAGKIYLGVWTKGQAEGDSGSTTVLRDGYALRLGFDPDHPENYIGIGMIENCIEKTVDSNDPSKTTVHNALSTSEDWYQASMRGIVSSYGSYTWNVKDSRSGAGTTTLSDGSKRTVYDSNTASTYPVTAMKVVKQTVSGNDFVYGGGYGRTSEQVYTYWEIELDKAKLLAFYNLMYAEGTGVADLDTMLFSVSHFHGLSGNGYVPQSMWNGSFGDTSSVSHALEAYTFDVVEFSKSEAKTYNVDGYAEGSPSADGTIGANEHQTTVELAPVAYSASQSIASLTKSISDGEISEQMSISFSHTADKLYIALYDKSGTTVGRSSYMLRLGFDENNPQNSLGIFTQCVNFTMDSSGTKTAPAEMLATRCSGYIYHQSSLRGIAPLNSSTYYQWKVDVHSSHNGITAFKYTDGCGADNCGSTDTRATYPITAQKMVREDVDGSLTLGTHGRISSGQYYSYYEIEIDKAKMMAYLNSTYGTSYTMLPETMLFSVGQCDTNNGSFDGQMTMWNGAFADSAWSEMEGAMKHYTYDKVKFTHPHDFSAETVYDVNETESTFDKAPTCEGQGVYFKSCSVCGLIGEDEEKIFNTDPAGHTGETHLVYNNGLESDNPGYLKHWTVCSVCETDDNTPPDGASVFTAHTYDQAIEKDDALYIEGSCTGTPHQYFYSCLCGCSDTDEENVFNGQSVAHIWETSDAPDLANQKTPADCYNPAVYYEVCSTCGNSARGIDESRTYEYGEVRAHNMVDEPAKPATCIAIGWEAHQKCSYECGYTEGFVKIDPTRWVDANGETLSQADINKGDHTSLAEFGQKIYATGTKNYMAADGVMYLDGDNNVYEPYVQVTPNFVNKTGLAGDYYSNAYGSSGIEVDNTSVDYTSNIKYYVAQDNDNVYLLIEDYAPYVEVDGTDGLSARHESILRNFYNVRIGFDAENYDRAIFFRLQDNITSLGVMSGESSTNILNNDSVNSIVKYAFERYNSSGNPSGQKKNNNYYNQSAATATQWVARFEIKIDKSLVDNAYALLNDSKETEFDFSTMFVSVSTRAIRYDADGNAPSAYAFYGSYTGADGVTAGLPENYVPDVIVFGEDKNSSLTTDHNCVLTDHRIDEKYLYNRVDNGDGTGIAEFYHTCKNVSEDGKKCSVMGATTFKVTYSTVDGEIVYGNEVILGQPEGIPNAKFAVTPVTCTEQGTYYMHCPCGAEGMIDHENTYTIDALGHNWIDHDRDYHTPRYCPSCKETSDSVYIEQPEDVINLLMIGNSFCFYFVEELYAIANAAGIELNVANLYISGRSVYAHHQHILGNDDTPYQFFVTNSSGRNEIDSVTTIDGALAYADWDVVTFQQHFYPNMATNYDKCIDDTLEDATALFNYVKTNEPNAKLYWQQSWAFQVGYSRPAYNDGTILTEAVQAHTYKNIKAASEAVAEANGVTLVPSGDAWQIVRDEYGYDGLCDKPGNSGDYYHDGDVGGGQYLNACVWFETVTGYSCLGNQWRPDDQSVAEASRYSLNINAAILQEAAHKAVAQIYGPGYARHDHNYSAATCTAPETCIVCGIVKEGSAPLGHTNATHPSFTDSCELELTDRNCTRCGLYINKKHQFDGNKTCTVCGQSREGWIAPDGITTYYATDVSNSAPRADGEIGLEEYGRKVTVKTPSLMSDFFTWGTGSVDKIRAAEYMDYYFAYDEENIYVALREVSNGLMSRSNYRFEFGFDLDNVRRYFMFEGFITNGTGEGTGWANLTYYDDNNTKKIAHLATYDLIDGSFIRKIDGETHRTLTQGDLLLQQGNGNNGNKKWEFIVEFKLSKEDIIKCMNELYGTNYTTLSDAMWISVGTRTYDASLSSSQVLKWIGQNDVSQYIPDGIDPNWQHDWMFDIVVFGDEDTDIVKANPNPCEGGHTITHCPAKAPTATEPGHEAYDKCTVCNYKDNYVEIPPYDVFKTGYSRVDISPKVSQAYPIGGFDRGADALYATCVAVNDGQDSAMFISIDIKSINVDNNTRIRELVEIATGIPADNVFVSATHTHSSFTLNTDELWKFEAFKGIMDAAKEAVADLEVTEIRIGSAEADGAYVRRYKQVEVNNWTNSETATGLFRSRGPGGSSSGMMTSTVWRTVAEADKTLQVARLVRDGKDIVMTNWQAHLAHAVQTTGMTTSISSDIAHYMREDIEKGDTDTQVIYFAGASGNITLTDTDTGTTEDYKAVSKALATTALGIIQGNMEKINAGKIETDVQTYQAATRKDGKDSTKYPTGTAKFDEMYQQMYVDKTHSFTDYTMAERYFYEGNDSEYKELRLGAVAIGELGFVVAPYEMFDDNGEFIKEESAKLGFKMTFILTNAGGDYAYMPSEKYYTAEYGYSGDYFDTESTDNPGTYTDEGDWGDPYEVLHSYFGVGTAEATADKFVEMLAALWARGEVVDINIVYTSMNFTYTAGLWNPNELMYEEGTWTADSTDGGQITVTNYSRAQVSVTFAFDAEDDYDLIRGVFSGTDGTNLVNNATSLPGKDQIYVTFTLTGLPTGPLNDVTVGHITITIADAAAAAGGE